ncbi:fucose kinase [Novymonas esmeraldas]|uniref:Fucose kinase n=1 Tax=Novymonas esmeraldas TaxID=1808958 RepID=A0AAW0EX62_9TRYP
MNVSFLFNLPSGLAEYVGAKKLLADAAAFAVEGCVESSGVTVPELFCGCDPDGAPLGSGGGTVHLLHECYAQEQRQARAGATRQSFMSWLKLADNDGRVIVHAGGQSRRLPAYSTLGKALLPLPPCRWHRGSQLARTLLSTQVPKYRALVAAAPAQLRTLIACGDICVYLSGAVPMLRQFVDTDVLCLGVRADPHLLQNHGVFFMSRQRPYDLSYMLQKPSLAELRRRATESSDAFLLDVGMWLLSDRAVEVLSRKCIGGALDDVVDSVSGGTVVRHPYDLYSQFGSALGTNPSHADPEVVGLKTSVVELHDAAFLHYGTNRQLITSTQTLQSRESLTPSWSWGTPFDGVLAPARHGEADTQLESPTNLAAEELDLAAGDAMSLLATQSSVIVHNAVVLAPLDGSAAAAAASRAPSTPVPTRHLWVESSWIGAGWVLHDWHILTGIPRNNWRLTLPLGVCVSVVPVLPAAALGSNGSSSSSSTADATPRAARPYHVDDMFRGDVGSADTVYMGMPLHDWLSSRGFTVADLRPAGDRDGNAALDIYAAALFPVCATEQQLGDFLYTATLPLEALARGGGAVDAARLAAGQAVWRTQPRVSATDLLRWTNVPAMLRDSEYYERRMLTLTLALVATSPAQHNGSVTAPPSATEFALAGLQRSVLTPPMVALLQQLFFLLDLNRVAQRVVELGVALPRQSAVTKGWDEVDEVGSVSVLSHQPDAADALAGGEDTRASNWAHIFGDARGGGGPTGAPLCSAPRRIVVAHYHMFVSRVLELTLEAIDTAQPPLSASAAAHRLALLRTASVEEAKSLVSRHDSAAFAELRAAIMGSFPDERQSPKLGVHLDQIIWGRCPIRIDIAGAWTDTPPYTLLDGGSVINVAVELNGQPPVQVYVRVREDAAIIVHSIDSGERLRIESFDELRSYATMQNPFSIPKAALALCGFLPEFCATQYATLQEQLTSQFGGHGLEVSLLVAIPTGSGLGTSSIVSGTVLRSLAEFCKLPWDDHAVCRRVLLIEQMLTAGGGWQDQYGGLFEGLKLVQSTPGLPCLPTVRWMPHGVFTDPRFASCHLLYYTGITRMAKGILAEIVREVFLNNRTKLQLLREMGGPHTAAMYDAITTNNYKAYALLVHRTWQQKKRLDDGVCNAAVQAIIDVVEPYVWGLTLPGAGGGGYMYMCAKDEACARRIRALLTASPPNPNARFVEMSVSTTGLQISHS